MNTASTILIAEDDDGHAQLVERNLKRAGVTDGILRVADGQQALEVIYGEGLFAAASVHRPWLVLLDVNMPKLGGVEVLRRLKADPRHQPLPVIMLTTTDDSREIAACYELGCSCYITKPIDYDEFVETIRRLAHFLQIVRKPGERAPVAAN